MLKDSLYTVLSVSAVSEIKYRCRIGLMPDCEIYKAHFPCFPITPGVCLMQIGLEMTSEILHLNKLASAPKIRFLMPVIPSRTGELEYKIENNCKSVNISVEGQDCTYATMIFEFEE